jgi:ABC-type phosphate transport system substrate-binding protein
VAFSYRPLTPAEQALFREADGDTAITVPVAVGGLVLLRGAEAATGPVTLAGLREALTLLAAEREPAASLAAYCDRLYVCDPNEGSWDALFGALDLPVPAPAAPGAGPVVFLVDPAAVAGAVAEDPRAWGLVSTLDAGEVGDFVAVVAADGDSAVSPVAANIATGDYPLHHFLHAVCRGAGSLEGGKFITHLASARGLRQVERAGVVPARLVARTIQLSRDPVGGN